ncbi:unnamed protein product [Pleuronectes platessa]|uniref:Uncharacterized protein n=1 Tax=Pleuronectes platessa TaxID=8262 RepID=A0A9N7Y421_PLEPL|nr:unnamed protein product [Pleuronectes platessa]
MEPNKQWSYRKRQRGSSKGTPYMGMDERANASRAPPASMSATRQTFKWPHKQGTPGTPLNVDSTVWMEAAAAPAQAPTAPTAPTAGLRWGAGALAARLRLT